jgi:hypothetical protein
MPPLPRSSTALTSAQLHQNAEALHAFADGHPVQYWSDTLGGWTDSENGVDCRFAHRVKPKDVEPRDEPIFSAIGPDDFPGQDTPHSPAAHKILSTEFISTDVRDY